VHGQLPHHRADHEGIEVDVDRLLVHQEVLVADVASAGDRHHAVGDEQLVVHAGIARRPMRAGAVP
jgi:hypothetical protein